jgi:hypothetical protein
VIEDMAQPENEKLLRELGRVEPPVPAVLEAAREALWSAVAGDMLGTDPPGGRSRTAGSGRPRDESRHEAEPGS